VPSPTREAPWKLVLPVDTPDERSSLAQAAAWTSRITTISAEMVIPGIGGYWLDLRWGTKPVFLLVGVFLGLALGMWHLLKLAAQSTAGRGPHDGPRREDY